MTDFSIFPEVREAILACGGEAINTCMQCGTCAATCPWGRVEEASPFNIRAMIHMGRLGYEGFETEDFLYACTTCSHCASRCPRQVKIVDVVRAMRSVISETGSIPKTLRAPQSSIGSNGNPWGQERAERVQWTKSSPVKEFTTDTEYFLSVCCTSAYDGRSQNIARSVTRLLEKAGVDFGVIGASEQCCGESLRKTGAEEDFTRLAESNISLFQEKGVREVVTTSPHCLYTFKNEYPELGGEFTAKHYTELLAELVQEGKLEFNQGEKIKVIYHDPCYLGRHNGIYDAPRELIRALPGVELLEFNCNRQDSLCCGGGGGRIWMETKSGQRFSDQKVKEALASGASVIATACPYCIVMLEDSVKNLDCEERLTVKDVSELLAERLK